MLLATPIARVIAALVGYLRMGERTMALVSAGILGVAAAAVVLGMAGV
jgi:hypothetical protein